MALPVTTPTDLDDMADALCRARFGTPDGKPSQFRTIPRTQLGWRNCAELVRTWLDAPRLPDPAGMRLDVELEQLRATIAKLAHALRGEGV